MAPKPRNILLASLFVLVGLLFTQCGFTAPFQSIPTKTWTYPDGYDPHGVYLDRVTFRVYPPEDEQLGLFALQAGVIYAWDENVLPPNIIECEGVAGLSVTTEPGDSCQVFCLNCDRFPTNITGYRRALAYALDKGSVIQASTAGLAFYQDSVLPIALGNWSYEGQLTETYYQRDIIAANASLEAAGFRDLDGNGWRDYDADNSTTLSSGDILDVAFAIELWYNAGNAPAGNAVEIACQGLHLCGIMGEVVPQYYYDFLEMLRDEEYWLVCFTQTDMASAEILYNWFHSSTSYNKLCFGGWTNATYDAAAEALMNAATIAEVNDWAWKCQQILWYEQPMIVCYNDVYTHAYRTDRWEGYVNMACRNRIGNGKSLVHIRLKETAGGPWGCIPTEYILSLQEGLDTTNWLMSNSKHTTKVFQLVYEGLWTLSPYDWTPQPALAYAWETEATAASGDIQDGEKYTFHLYDNATWHDGTPLTAYDVAFSLSLGLQDPYNAENYANIYRVNAVDSKTVELFTNQSGYFEWFRSTRFTIYPLHIWSIPENITTWVPTIFELVGSGPYIFTYYFPGDYLVLERNPTWHFRVDMPQRTTCPTSTLDYSLWYYLGFTVIIIQTVILVYLIDKRRKYKENEVPKET